MEWVAGAPLAHKPFEWSHYSWWSFGMVPTKAVDGPSLLHCQDLLYRLADLHPTGEISHSSLDCAFLEFLKDHPQVDKQGLGAHDLAQRLSTCVRTMLLHIRRAKKQKV
eukprot:13506132-Alexandrium_andersonii.AAC.1